MTDHLNGATPPDPLQSANIRFAKAYAQAAAPGGRLQLNPMQLLIELELLKINLGVLIEQACEGGMDPAAFNAATVMRLNAQADALEGPKLAIAPAGVLGRKR